MIARLSQLKSIRYFRFDCSDGFEAVLWLQNSYVNKKCNPIGCLSPASREMNRQDGSKRLVNERRLAI